MEIFNLTGRRVDLTLREKGLGTVEVSLGVEEGVILPLRHWHITAMAYTDESATGIPWLQDDGADYLIVSQAQAMARAKKKA